MANIPPQTYDDPLSVLVVSYQACPSDSVLEQITPYFWAIAKTYSRKAVLPAKDKKQWGAMSREDREDAQGEIYLYMLEVLNRPQGHPMSRYDNTIGKANSFFTSVARTKAWNIRSAHTTRTRRLDSVVDGLLDYGPFVWVDE